MLVVPKKDNIVHIVSDFEGDNILIKRRSYPLMLVVHKNIQKISAYFAKLDLSIY